MVFRTRETSRRPLNSAGLTPPACLLLSNKGKLEALKPSRPVLRHLLNFLTTASLWLCGRSFTGGDEQGFEMLAYVIFLKFAKLLPMLTGLPPPSYWSRDEEKEEEEKEKTEKGGRRGIYPHGRVPETMSRIENVHSGPWFWRSAVIRSLWSAGLLFWGLRSGNTLRQGTLWN